MLDKVFCHFEWLVVALKLSYWFAAFLPKRLLPTLRIDWVSFFYIFFITFYYVNIYYVFMVIGFQILHYKKWFYCIVSAYFQTALLKSASP